MPVRSDRPLTDAKRRALVRSGIGSMAYRLSAERVAAIAADCARLDLDARGTVARAAVWGAACRRALDDGRPLPDALEVDALASAAAAAPMLEHAADDAPDAATGAAA